ncbi:MAG: 2-oxo acid dehydrogenase subunit E2, partial [Parvularculaceae bacterium]
MPIPILMPALSPTMEEGTLAKWKVKEGDKVSSGDVIAEIETDKATMEVEAVDEGIVGRIVVPAGTENVKVNATIAILLGEGENAGDVAKAPAKANGYPSPLARDSGGGAGGEGPASARTDARNEAALPQARPTHGVTPQAGDGNRKNGRIHASPLAKRLAKAAGIDLSALKGSGPHGRIVKRDVESAPKGAAAPKAAPAAAFTPSPAAVDPRLYPADSYMAVKLDGMRKVIARRLTQSFNNEVPHFPLNIDIELTKLLEARASLNAASPKEGAGAYKLSVNDFIIKASALALKKVPNANATFTDEAILLHKHADIGVAVAIDGGLITPIVWKAETKGLREISAEIKDLAA